MRARRVQVIGGICIALVSCGAAGGCSPLGAPSANPAATAKGTAAVSRAQATHEYRGAAPPRQGAAAPSLSAAAAVRAFAAEYINWNADTVSAQMLRLAGRSIGQARSAMQLAAAETGSDYELRRGGIANHGTVEAVARLRSSETRFAVLTLESTTATLSTAYQGLRPAWHVTVASVSQLAPGQWVVSGWQPVS